MRIAQGLPARFEAIMGKKLSVERDFRKDDKGGGGALIPVDLLNLSRFGGSLAVSRALRGV